MQMDLEDVVALLTEELQRKESLALTPQDSVQKQYTNLGVAEGVRVAIRKLNDVIRRENHYG